MSDRIVGLLFYAVAALVLAFACWCLLSQFAVLTSRGLFGLRLDVLLAIWTGPVLADQLVRYIKRRRARDLMDHRG
ncbi:MAG: hypothetical protein V4574_04755 [Pseudomonadota bacterium]